jgi:uncharacterized membrane protein
MAAGAHRFGGVLLVLILLGTPPAAHVALMHRANILAGILVALQAVLVTWIALAAITQRTVRAGACSAVLLFVLFLSRFTNGGPLAASEVPFAMAYLALLAFFADSLRVGREPIVTILARKSRGLLSAEIAQYTRRVTWAWCGFFVMQLLVSLLLLLFASPQVWSWFVNLCNLPLIGAMFGAEYAYRRWRHAGRSPERLVDTLRRFRQIRTVPTGETNSGN